MGSTISLNRYPSHERLERLALLGEWHMNSGRKDLARECFETVLKWRPEAREVRNMMQFLATGQEHGTVQ